MSRIALIDADEIAYKIALSFQQKFYWVCRDDKRLWKTEYKIDAVESIENAEDLTIEEEVEVYDPHNYKRLIDDFIISIIKFTHSDSSRLYLSGEDNFRYQRASLLPYKGNREASNKPFHLELIQNRLREIGATSVDVLEADDMMSSNESRFKNTIICSTDKDLRTVPSYNYNISTGVSRFINYDEALHNFFIQLLIGDSTDNIPSPYLLGETKSNAFLEKHKSTVKDIKWYRKEFIPFYSSFLLAKDPKKGDYKTKWYDGRDVELVLYEVGDLLWMRRNFDPLEDWRNYYFK